MAAIFDGREFASEKLKEVAKEVKELKKSGVTPKLASILVGDDPASKLYLSLKKKKAEDVGAQVEVVKLEKDIKTEKLKEVIRQLNKNEKVHGIMVQLPLPGGFSQAESDEIINTIDSRKDVDGMRDDSPFLAPVVKVIEEVMSMGEKFIRHHNYLYLVVVIGAKGFVGKKIIRRLREYNPRIYKIVGVDIEIGDLEAETKNADFLISTTGKEGLVTRDMVKEGTVVIDVGSPKGDVKTQEVQQKAAFISPVPGGIGPVTIACLLENLVLAAKDSIAK